MSVRSVVLAAGGTGGHMFPAEALARELLARGWKVALVTDRRGEAFGDRVPGVTLHRIRAGRLGDGVVAKMAAVADMALGTLSAGRLLRALLPAAAVGFGGYPSVPTMLAATRQGIASVLHEQNAILGRANRLLASRVGTIATSFPGVSASARTRIVEIGNPVRPEIAALRNASYLPPGADGPINLLVVGGSQGARILSAVIPAALGLLEPALKARLAVMQQARSEDLAEVRRTYQTTGIDAETATFFDDVPARLARAHLVIARAGASTVAELTAIGRPAILIPYRYAADDHQTANARSLADAGAAWMVGESEFTPDRLAMMLGSLLMTPDALSRAASSSHRLGRPDAASRLADLVVAAAGGSNGQAPIPKEHAA
jgi:UDP-N-acetylglucosamine--N-acetylmuramyl-(pentapeptide) pyrophosphoryl-undecaprenol N-acetylglucosamine transferase